jgi:quercetin 2,3-dioxygenase
MGGEVVLAFVMRRPVRAQCGDVAPQVIADPQRLLGRQVRRCPVGAFSFFDRGPVAPGVSDDVFPPHVASITYTRPPLRSIYACKIDGMSTRSVIGRYAAVSDDIGDLRTQRPLPNDELEQIDPFLFLNHHGPQVYPPNNRGLPFGPHPHRGFETVTFILEGSLSHEDTGGHASVIDAGGVQWMTAGRGLEHAELSPESFRRIGGPLEILQLWVNLPSRLKMTEPRYVGLQREEIPSVARDGATVHVISGSFDGVTGPVESLTGVVMMTLSLQAGARVTLDAPRGRNVFFYIVRGELNVGRAMELVHFADDGDSIDAEAVADSFVLFGHAEPYDEPVVAHGPFVMNTREEIVQAFRDYQQGLFR